MSEIRMSVEQTDIVKVVSILEEVLLEINPEVEIRRETLPRKLKVLLTIRFDCPNQLMKFNQMLRSKELNENAMICL